MAAASLAESQSLPPHARAAPEPPVVPTPVPRVNPPTVTFGSVVVAARGDVPKLLVPPGRLCTSQPARTPAIEEADQHSVPAANAHAKSRPGPRRSRRFRLPKWITPAYCGRRRRTPASAARPLPKSQTAAGSGTELTPVTVKLSTRSVPLLLPVFDTVPPFAEVVSPSTNRK